MRLSDAQRRMLAGLAIRGIHSGVSSEWSVVSEELIRLGLAFRRTRYSVIPAYPWPADVCEAVGGAR